jgi:hypothetical protein
MRCNILLDSVLFCSAGLCVPLQFWLRKVAYGSVGVLHGLCCGVFDGVMCVNVKT